MGFSQITASIFSDCLIWDHDPSRPWTFPHHLWQDSRFILYISSPNHLSEKFWFLFMGNGISRPQSECQGCSLLLNWSLFLGLISQQMLESTYTQTHIWASFRWWKTGKPGVLQFMVSQRVGHDWPTKQQPVCSKTYLDNPKRTGSKDTAKR